MKVQNKQLASMELVFHDKRLVFDAQGVCTSLSPKEAEVLLGYPHFVALEEEKPALKEEKEPTPKEEKTKKTPKKCVTT